MLRTVVGAEHLDTLTSMSNLAADFSHLGHEKNAKALNVSA